MSLSNDKECVALCSVRLLTYVFNKHIHLSVMSGTEAGDEASKSVNSLYP